METIKLYLFESAVVIVTFSSKFFKKGEDILLPTVF